MTKKQKYLYIVLPIFIFTFIINFYVKDDNSPPSVKEYLFNDFEKAEYQVKDLVTGDVLGDFYLTGDENKSFSINSKSTFGKLMIGEFGREYAYNEIDLSKIEINKNKCKNLEFYTGKVGDWYTVVIMILDNKDYREFYPSENNRYLFYILKNSNYNFSIKDESVYNLYLSFNADLSYMIYAAILE